MDPDNTTVYPGSIAVRGTDIVDLGPSASIDPQYAAQKRIQADGHVIMPGLVNIHGHASNSLIRGLGADLALQPWLEQICWPCMAQADDEDLYSGVLLSCLEMLLNGVTTFADMWPGVGMAAQAVEKSGQRALLAHNIKDFGEPERGQAELALAVEAWTAWDGHADGRVHVGLGPHSVYTCQPRLLADCADAAQDHGLHIQIHGSETAQEVENSRARFGRSPIELMDEVGLLGNHTVVAHAVHVNSADIDLLQTSGSAVAHNIASNLKLASGIAPIHRFLEEGIRVGIGTDGPGSNDGLDLLKDLKIAALVQKAAEGDPTALSAQQSLAMATTDGAAALGLGDHIGSLEVGKRADLILLDFDSPRFTPRHFDHPGTIRSHLVNCATGADVDTVIVDGKVLVRNGRAVELDTKAIIRAARQSSQRILAAAGWAAGPR